MTTPLSQRYLARITAAGAGSAGLTAAADRSPLLEAAYGGRGRFLPQPVFLTDEQRRRVTADLARLHDLLLTLPGRLFDGSLDAFCREVGLTGPQVDAVRRTRSRTGAPPRLSRADLYPDEAGFTLLEYNYSSALGGFDNTEINAAMLDSPVLKDFVADEGLTYPDTLAEIARTVMASYRAARPDSTDRPVLALADWPASYPSLAPRLRYMADRLSQFGFDAMACHAGQFEQRAGDLSLEGKRVDIVYRFFLSEDLLDPEAGTLLDPVIRAHESGRVHLFTGFDTELYGSKGSLSLLAEESYRGAFDAEELAFVDRFLPWSRAVRRREVHFAGTAVDLLDLARAQRCDFVLKPNLLHGGIGIVCGWTVTDAQWAAALEEAVDGPYVLQRRVRATTETFLDGHGSTGEFVLNWGVFLAADGYAGSIVRGTDDADVGVLSMGTGARVGCCFVPEPGPAGG